MAVVGTEKMQAASYPTFQQSLKLQGVPLMLNSLSDHPPLLSSFY